MGDSFHRSIQDLITIEKFCKIRDFYVLKKIFLVTVNSVRYDFLIQISVL